MVSIVEARDLLIPTDAGELKNENIFIKKRRLIQQFFFLLSPQLDPDCIDTFVRVYLLPDESEAMQTKIFRNSNNPSYQESFLFFIAKQYIKRSLWFHLYHTNAHCTTLIGDDDKFKILQFQFLINFSQIHRRNGAETYRISKTHYDVAPIDGQPKQLHKFW